MILSIKQKEIDQVSRITFYCLMKNLICLPILLLPNLEKKSSKSFEEPHLSITTPLRRLVSSESLKNLRHETINVDDDEERFRPSIIAPLRRLSLQSFASLQEEEINADDDEEAPRPLIVLPLRRLSRSLEQAVTALFQSESNADEEKVKINHNSLNMCDVVNDKEEFKKFKEYARNNCVTTNIAVQKIIFIYAESKDANVPKQKDSFGKRGSFDTSIRRLSHSNSSLKAYRVEKDEKAGYNWIDVPTLRENLKPIRRGESFHY